jgi:hypothetical protein
MFSFDKFSSGEMKSQIRKKSLHSKEILVECKTKLFINYRKMINKMSVSFVWFIEF